MAPGIVSTSSTLDVPLQLHVTTDEQSSSTREQQLRTDSVIADVNRTIGSRLIDSRPTWSIHRDDAIDIDRQPKRRALGIPFTGTCGPQGIDNHVPFSYYKFVKLDGLSTVQPGDIRFLEMNGSLHVPTRPILNEFMNEFFLYVHPGLSILDESIFWAMYRDIRLGSSEQRNISLFLLQAMVFVSCSVCCYHTCAEAFSEKTDSRNSLCH